MSLGDIVVAYLEHLEATGELDLDSATEFLVLIASLLELKSRLLLPTEDEEQIELGPEEAADELLARMLEYRRYREAAAHLSGLFADGRRYLYRAAPLPPELRRASLEAASHVYDPTRLARGPWRPAARPAGAGHQPHPADGLARAAARGASRAAHAPRPLRLRRGVRRRGPSDPGGDPVRPARDAQARRGDAGRRRTCSDRSRWRCNDCSRAHGRGAAVPVAAAGVDRGARAGVRRERGGGRSRAGRARGPSRRGLRGVVLRQVAGGYTLAADPVAEDAARRLLSTPRTPPLTQAQAETLAIVSYLQPVSRPEIARIRGVSSESAVATLTERGLIEESGRSRFGAIVYRTTQLFEKLFGLSGPRPAAGPLAVRPDARGRARAPRAPAEGGRAAGELATALRAIALFRRRSGFRFTRKQNSRYGSLYRTSVMSMRSLPSGVPFWKKSVANAWSSAFAAFRVREAWILRKVRSRPWDVWRPPSRDRNDMR